MTCKRQRQHTVLFLSHQDRGLTRDSIAFLIATRQARRCQFVSERDTSYHPPPPPPGMIPGNRNPQGAQ